jgi:hypothetical protein
MTQSAQYELAAFAWEELLLIAPENYLYHLHYAEVITLPLPSPTSDLPNLQLLTSRSV